jgi:hypothetical protein
MWRGRPRPRLRDDWVPHVSPPLRDVGILVCLERTMGKGTARTYRIKRAASLCCLMVAASSIAQTAPPTRTLEGTLRKFLQDYLWKPYPAIEQQALTRYSSAFVDLKDDGTKEVIVYVSGRGWCGSGGCVMLILAPEGAWYKVVTKATATRLPIRVLGTKTNGWHDISVVVGGGGIQPAYEAMLSFDGTTYPSNPSIPPARQMNDEAQGRTVIDVNAKDTSLYR